MAEIDDEEANNLIDLPSEGNEYQNCDSSSLLSSPGISLKDEFGVDSSRLQKNNHLQKKSTIVDKKLSKIIEDEKPGNHEGVYEALESNMDTFDDQ